MHWSLALAATFLLQASAELLPRAQAAGSSVLQQEAAETATGPSLELGEPSRSRDRDATVALVFTPRRGEPAGTFHAEVTLPSGPWRFQRAEAPPRSGWKVSSRNRRERSQGSAPGSEYAVIEVSADYGSRALPHGLVGYLRFRLEERDSPLPAGLTVAKLDVEPPAIEVSAPTRSPDFAPLSNDPTLSPTVTCFIFSH